MLPKWILTASLASEHFCLFIVPKWIRFIQLLFQSTLFPLVMRVLSALRHSIWKTAAVTVLHFLFAPSPHSYLFHMQNYIRHKCMQTLLLLERNKFSSYILKKKTSVTQVSCVVLRLWEGLSNPKLVVKSCLHKSEVMFFLWSKNSARRIQLLKAGENSKKENVLATEMRWKQTNMLRQSGTRDKSLDPHLPPPLTSAHGPNGTVCFPL